VRVKSGSVNIREVARVAQVGVATVSRVINGSDLISRRTRERVQAVIRRLGYRPNAQARRILGHSQMICFVLANRPFLHSFHAGVLQGAETAASELNHHVVFLRIDVEKKTPPDQILLPPILEEKGWVDGVIVSGAVYPNLISRIKALGLPLVVFGNNVFDVSGQSGLDQVRYNGTRAEFEATKYLINLGHRLISFVGDIEYPWFCDQYGGYLKALRTSTLNPIALTGKGPGTFVEYGRWAAECLLKGKRVATAILAGNDEIAYGLCRSFRRLRVRIPDDISLIGFDDREIAAVMDPPLTTVQVCAPEIGRCCMELLVERLRNPSQGVSTRLVHTRLVERESVQSKLGPSEESGRQSLRLSRTAGPPESARASNQGGGDISLRGWSPALASRK